ncbi:MAG: type IV pilin protein [Elusimicrobiota bacterium]
MKVRSRKGFTLIELVVTMLIIGVLAAFAIPQYLKTVEAGKADDAVAIMNMIGTTNKMFALDHNGYYVNGAFPASPCAGLCAGAAACPTTNVTTAQTNACILVCCKYLADQDWSTKPYNFSACDPGSGSGGTLCASTMVASTKRLASAYSPYNGWGYTMTSAGVIALSGAAPPPTY